MPAGRPTKYKPEFCEVVINVGKEGGSLAKMAVECGVSMSTFQDWQQEWPKFRAAVKAGRLHSQVKWEEMGMNGTFDKDAGLSASAFIFQMKNRFPHDYRDKIDHDVDVSGEIEVIIGETT